ncbi:MAG: SDR family NAD(P)-dependent oxidoreductase, partial [Candidatus Methylomirabilota bacterium]
MRLMNRVVLITGGGRGIGAATAKVAAAEGGRVVIADMLEAEGEATAAAIRAGGGRALFVRTDVTAEADCARLAQAAAEAFGGIDALVCCAGILQGAMQEAEALEPAVFDRVLQVNLKGAFLTVRAALPHLRKAARAAVILLASEAGVKIPSSSLAYGASKGGVHGLAMTLEAQLAPHGIRVNDVCPSSIATPMRIENLVDRAKAAGQDPEEARARAIREAGDPLGVAKILAFLASPDAEYLRGT